MKLYKINNISINDSFIVASIRYLNSKISEELPTTNRRQSIDNIPMNKKCINNVTLLIMSNFFIESFKDEVIENYN